MPASPVACLSLREVKEAFQILPSVLALPLDLVPFMRLDLDRSAYS